jgi:diguanylate cyclase (GGDEF)-like protein
VDSAKKAKIDLCLPWRFLVHIPQERASWFAGEQVKAFHNGQAAGGNVVTGIAFSVLTAICHSLVASGLILVATALTSLLRNARRRRYLNAARSIKTDEAERAWILRHALVVGLIWSGACFAMVTSTNSKSPTALALLFPGLMFLGSFALDVIYAASLRFIALVTLGMCAGLMVIGGEVGIFGTVGTAIYGLIFAWRAKLSSTGFAMRTISGIEAKEASETIHLLLNDYEEHSSDWLWEIGADQHLIKPSERFQRVSARDADALSANPLISLFDASPERDMLESMLVAQKSFRDIALRITIAGTAKWWSLSGHAVKDGNGQVIGMRGFASDVSSAKLADAQISYLALYDSLTELPNRSLFSETLTRALVRRSEAALTAVLYLDLDHFKTINDTLGHPAGDAVLKTAAERIKSCVTAKDVVARQGGDEFAVVLPEIKSRGEAEAIAKAIVLSLAAPIIVDGQQVNTGASIGIAYAPDDVSSAEHLIKYADMALYHSKRNGRGRYSNFEYWMHEAMQAKRKIELDLRVAISRNELELYYQPIVNLETGETAGYEALLRWNHPENGVVMPGVFIPVAEDTNLIVPLGEWVIRIALMEVRLWPQHLSVSLNVSPAQLRSTNLIPTIIHALAASGVAAERLELEITETVLMQDSHANLAVLHQLRALGVRIALDDFGTGHSSLNYLRNFPFDKIKIDRCFVDEVDNREDSRAIIRAVTSLASSLGMVTTAEGVERKEQLDQLRKEGCTEVQGYFFAKPMPAIHIVGRTTSTQAISEAA